jgi:hypothetical protein
MMCQSEVGRKRRWYAVVWRTRIINEDHGKE